LLTLKGLGGEQLEAVAPIMRLNRLAAGTERMSAAELKTVLWECLECGAQDRIPAIMDRHPGPARFRFKRAGDSSSGLVSQLRCGVGVRIGET
jgi:hypothetical protein